MLEPREVDVNGRMYTVNPLNADEAHEFLHALISARATGHGMAELGKQVFAHCCDHMLRPLDNKENFQKQFAEFPQDMLELEAQALQALCDPWELESGPQATGQEDAHGDR